MIRKTVQVDVISHVILQNCIETIDDLKGEIYQHDYILCYENNYGMIYYIKINLQNHHKKSALSNL